MILRRRRNRNFTIVPNELWTDEKLSFAAKGLHAYLLHFPDNWEFHLGHLAKQAGFGRDKLRRHVNELVDRGWIERQIARDDGTKTFAGVSFLVRDWPEQETEQEPGPENQSPAIEPAPEKPGPGKPALENTALLNNQLEKELREQNPPNPPEGELVEISFADFWQHWKPVPQETETRNGAERAWSRLIEKQRRDAFDAIERRTPSRPNGTAENGAGQKRIYSMNAGPTSPRRRRLTRP